MLIVSGSEDRSVSPRRSEEYQEILDEYALRCERIVVEGADHTFTDIEHERLVIEESVNWFKMRLVEGKRV